MSFAEQAVQKAGGLKALALILEVDYQKVQRWRSVGYVSSYRDCVKIADYLRVPLSDVVMERAEKLGEQKT